MGPKKARSQMLSLALRSDMKVAFQNDSSVLKRLFYRWSLNGFLGNDSDKGCHSVVLTEYYVERNFSSVVSQFSLRDRHWKSLIVDDEPLLMKAFKHSETFQKENDAVAKQPGTLQTVCT